MKSSPNDGNIPTPENANKGFTREGQKWLASESTEKILYMGISKIGVPQ
jgi:hypothetical protein